jgi:hypothetical protein
MLWGVYPNEAAFAAAAMAAHELSGEQGQKHDQENWPKVVRIFGSDIRGKRRSPIGRGRSGGRVGGNVRRGFVGLYSQPGRRITLASERDGFNLCSILEFGCLRDRLRWTIVRRGRGLRTRRAQRVFDLRKKTAATSSRTGISAAAAGASACAGAAGRR